ncbi:hypothetical protein [Deinococcus maricopensis]|uniref:Uncharacterized protein n=1 Tax=Deinococcus maricopensis (strain DSM 21211 / LMG 22137 / NRRL B-23946 / LB-34) TaxID=709986 RepID=E8U340_DEIML|nr:hypothetical protein [Deinococcus maricopensis]ADV65778.1 hypothetical protein Deima_0114 [Deinococcus maricopensis DSM 21211]
MPSSLREDAPAPIIVLDLRGSARPDEGHRQTLIACDAYPNGARLIVISTDEYVADIRIHPDTLDVNVQYAGVYLRDSAWTLQVAAIPHLPPRTQIILAVDHALRVLDPEERADVFVVGPVRVLPGLPRLTPRQLRDTLRDLAEDLR